jgi:cell division protein FtsB
MVFGSVVLGVLVLLAWFPGSALLQQHAALAATNSQLETLRHQDAALAQEMKNLNTPSEIERIARQQYDLVLPGQSAFQVLPPNGSTSGVDAPYAGDPGLQAPADPSGAPELPPGGVTVDHATGTHQHTLISMHTPTPSSTAAEGEGVFGRIVRTLEFWR